MQCRQDAPALASAFRTAEEHHASTRSEQRKVFFKRRAGNRVEADVEPLVAKPAFHTFRIRFFGINDHFVGSEIANDRFLRTRADLRANERIFAFTELYQCRSNTTCS